MGASNGDTYKVRTAWNCARGNARSYRGGQHVGARARSAHAFGAECVARGGDLAAAGAQARSTHAIGAERAAQGGDGSQRLRPPGTQARSALGAERRAPSA